jgi:hypothetical protein
MDSTTGIFHEMATVITSNSSYNKSIETLGSTIPLDTLVFTRLDNQLSKLSINDEELFSSETDYLASLVLFLLEHIPLEIDLNSLTSTRTDYHQASSTKMKVYKLTQNIIQHSSESQGVLDHLFQCVKLKNIEEFLLLKQNNQPIYLHCLNILSSLLLKTTYDKHPIAIQIFVHIIKSMRQLALSETFDLIFRVCLITLDDPSIDMKLISLYLLDHLQRNCTTTELSLFNRSNVIM